MAAHSHIKFFIAQRAFVLEPFELHWWLAQLHTGCFIHHFGHILGRISPIFTYLPILILHVFIHPDVKEAPILQILLFRRCEFPLVLKTRCIHISPVPIPEEFRLLDLLSFLQIWKDLDLLQFLLDLSTQFVISISLFLLHFLDNILSPLRFLIIFWTCIFFNLSHVLYGFKLHVFQSILLKLLFVSIDCVHQFNEGLFLAHWNYFVFKSSVWLVAEFQFGASLVIWFASDWLSQQRWSLALEESLAEILVLL